MASKNTWNKMYHDTILPSVCMLFCPHVNWGYNNRDVVFKEEK